MFSFYPSLFYQKLSLIWAMFIAQIGTIFTPAPPPPPFSEDYYCLFFSSAEFRDNNLHANAKLSQVSAQNVLIKPNFKKNLHFHKENMQSYYFLLILLVAAILDWSKSQS